MRKHKFEHYKKTFWMVIVLNHGPYYSCSPFYLQAWLRCVGTIQPLTTFIFSTALMQGNTEKSDMHCSECCVAKLRVTSVRKK